MSQSISRILGEKWRQNSETISISKSDLAAAGLTPGAANTAESLLAALLLVANESFEGKLTDERGNIITDEHNNPITYDNSNLSSISLNFANRYYSTRLGLSQISDVLLLKVLLPPETAKGTLINPNLV